MKKCRNCGRVADRTEDWACLWCGYPLLSRSATRIPKTYKQLKEERLRELKPQVAEVELEPAAEVEAEPVAEVGSEVEVEVEPEAVAEIEPEPVAEIEPVREAVPEAVAEPEAEPVVEVEPEPEPVRETEPEAEVEPEPVAEVEPEPVVESGPELVVESGPEPVPEAEPKPASAVIELTVEEVFSAYAKDEEEAHKRFTDNVIKVTGIVDRVAINEKNDNCFVSLNAAEKNEFRDVQCKFSREHVPELRRLNEGHTVTVQGKYAGYITDIMIRDCVLVH